MQETEFRRLRTAYLTAWRHLVIAVNLWQSQQAQSVAAQQAGLVVEHANNVYRKSRNELADYLLQKRSKGCANAATFQSRAEIFSDASRK
jgi:hypothetical protein